jgi:hypothetical protein
MHDVVTLTAIKDKSHKMGFEEGLKISVLLF